MNAVNKAEVHAVLAKKFGLLYADIWKVGVNLSLRISEPTITNCQVNG
jgi:hypothetical protein